MPKVKVSKNTYPVIWVGEKTKPYVRGFGRIVRIGEDETLYIQRLVWAPAGESVLPLEKVKGEKVLVTGGVSTSVGLFRAYAKVLKEESLPALTEYGKWLIPGGYGHKAWAVYIQYDWQPIDLREVSEDEVVEAYNPPEVYLVSRNELTQLGS